mgnify:CR=1 FL=1|jgi:hypothetical protein
MSKDDLKGLAARESASSITTKATSARATTGPRAPKYATKVDNFLRLLSEGHSIEAAAVGAELVRQTVYGWMDKHDDFKAEVEDARHMAEGSIMAELRGAATRKDDTRALMWLLSKLRPDLYGDKQALEVTTKKEDGVPEVIAMLQQTQHLVDKDSAGSADQSHKAD